MKKNTLHISVLHLDTEKTWRGGQQQVAYLLQGLAREYIQSMLVCQPRSPLHDFCREKHLPCEPVRMRGEFDFIAVLKLVRLVHKFKVNIIHAHSSHAQMLALWVKLFKPDVKIIAVRRVDFHIKKSFPAHLKYTSPKINVITTVSNRIKEVLISDGIPEDKLRVIYSGINIKKFNSTSPAANVHTEFQIPAGSKIVGTIAALAGHKDYPTLLKAAERVCRLRDDVYFMALGDGPLEGELKELRDELNLQQRFIFAGFKENPLAYLKAMDIFVLASKLEGLGTSILDARAMEKPIIATRTGGIPEALDGGKSGVLIEPGQAEMLAGAIIDLIENPQKAESLIANSRHSLEKFSVDNMVDGYLKLYEELTLDKITRQK